VTVAKAKDISILQELREILMRFVENAKAQERLGILEIRYEKWSLKE